MKEGRLKVRQKKLDVQAVGGCLRWGEQRIGGMVKTF